MKVSFTFNASLKQASAITPSTTSQNDLDDDNTIEITGTGQKRGTHRTTGGSAVAINYQVKGKLNLANLENMTMYDAFIPKVPLQAHSPRSASLN